MNEWAVILWPGGPVDVAQLWCLYDSGDILSNGEKRQCSSLENTRAISGVHIQHRPSCARLTVGIEHKRGTL